MRLALLYNDGSAEAGSYCLLCRWKSSSHSEQKLLEHLWDIHQRILITKEPIVRRRDGRSVEIGFSYVGRNIDLKNDLTRLLGMGNG
jgi:hypothetical protein